MLRLVCQALAYALFAFAIGCLSAWPEFRLLDDSEAMVSLSFSHAAERIEACRRLSQEELASLPPNMRKADECPRERHAVRVDLRVDGRLLHSETAAPSGIWRDGKANVYRRLRIVAGEREIAVGMSDSGNESGFDYELRRNIFIQPGRNLVISFDDLARTFVIE